MKKPFPLIPLRPALHGLDLTMWVVKEYTVERDGRVTAVIRSTTKEEKLQIEKERPERGW